MGVEFVGVGDIPSPLRVVIADSSPHGPQFVLASREGVAVSVFFTADWCVAGDGVDFENCVLIAVDGWVET